MIKCTLYKVKKYTLLAVSHKSFHSRIRISLGKGQPKDFDSILAQIKSSMIHYEASTNSVNREKVGLIISKLINEHKGLSVFDHLNDYWVYKAAKFNVKREKLLTKRSIDNYKNSLGAFEAFVEHEGINPIPSSFDKSVLDDFFSYQVQVKKNKHNTANKRHKAAKSYLKWLDGIGVRINPTYKSSTFKEVYYHSGRKDALSKNDLIRLVELKRRLETDDSFITIKKSSKISEGLRNAQLNGKRRGVKKALDLFLLMSCNGMYLSDVQNSEFRISVSNSGTSYMGYRRWKNNELASGIPIVATEYFILPELLKEYKITDGSKFPIDLSFAILRKHLATIGHLIQLEEKLQFKTARKTFASIYYFELGLELAFVSRILGHTSTLETVHYLGIKEDSLADTVASVFNNTKTK